ncbi:MAG: hypothetical protein ACP6IU_04880 [Candidatus Asgardarchaeia archaeon]
MATAKITVYELVTTAVTAALWFSAGLLGVFFVFAGVSYFWVPAGLNTPFGAWFGVYGGIGQAIANITLCMLFGFPFAIAASRAFAEFIEIMIPAVVYYITKINLELKSTRDWIIHILFGCVINVAVAAFIGNIFNAMFGLMTWEFAMTVGFTLWFIGDFLPALILGTLLLKTLSKYVTGTILYVDKIIYKTVTVVE